MKTKIKRRIFAIILAGILSAVIAVSAFGIGKTLTRKTALYGLASTAQDYGTIKLECNYSEDSHTLAVNQTTTYVNHSTQNLFDIKFHLYGNAFKK